MIILSLLLPTSFFVTKKLLFKSFMVMKLGSYISTLFGPSKIKSFNISTPSPLKPNIKISILENFSIASVPILPNCLEYKFISIFISSSKFDLFI